MMIISELKKIILQSELVSIERDCHDEELTGFVCEANENIVVMKLFTDDGDYDGFTVFETSQINEIYWGNREHKAIAHLVSKNETRNSIPKFKKEEFKDIIIEAGKSYENICIYLAGSEENFDIAQILESDNVWVKIHTYGVKSSLSRKYKMQLVDDISRIVIGSPYQNKIVSLYDEKL